MLSTLASPAEAPAAGGAVRRLLDELDRLVAEDVAAAPSAAEAAIRGRQGATVARIRGQVEQLGRTLATAAPGSPQGDAAVAFYATQVPPLASAQVQHEAQRRDEALAAMEALRARLSRLALGDRAGGAAGARGALPRGAAAAVRAARLGDGGAGRARRRRAADRERAGMTSSGCCSRGCG